jgi:hypothetical protein
VDGYLDDIREIERPHQDRSSIGTRSPPTRWRPDAPVGTPEAFEEHVKLMFDLLTRRIRARHPRARR